MRVPLTWLKDYVEFDVPTGRLVELFSLHSQEVDGVYRLGVLDGEVVVGEVQEFERHPNAERLFVSKVDLCGEIVQIVAGASNLYPGAHVPVVLPGSLLADGRKLKKARLRGLDSYGMMMSERELGISQSHEGILILEDSCEVGRPLTDYFPIGETVLDIDVMPNRPDLWGVIGVARELAAILRTDFKVPEPQFNTGGAPTGEYGLRVEADELCPRYDLRRVSGLNPGTTAPIWMRRRIHAAGMRPVSGIVDATNYVMLETGQPIHAFDAQKVRGGIVVRRAYASEQLTLLDGSVRTLDEQMLVIADEERGLVVAGVMGAEYAEVDERTSDVLIEVATFSGRNILETSQKLGLRTDASGRFERGLDPNMVDYACDRVSQFLTALADGRVALDTLSHYPHPVQPWDVPLRLKRAENLLGVAVREEEVGERLTSLGCRVQRENGHVVATVPTFRRDLTREVDLIEEVGRLIGLDRVPEELPAVTTVGGLTTGQQKVRLLRRVLVDIGLAEAVLYPFGPDRWADGLMLNPEDKRRRLARIKNPLSAEQTNLRSMLLPGLLDAAARNKAFSSHGGAFFEIGRVFAHNPIPQEMEEIALTYRLQGEKGLEVLKAARTGASTSITDGAEGLENLTPLSGIEETLKVAAVMAGTVRPGGWNVPPFKAGFFEIKGIVERLVPGATFNPIQEPFLHPGRAAGVRVGDVNVGWVGELHPQAVENFALEDWPVAAFELDLRLCDPDPLPHFREFVSVPAVMMDLALILDSGVPVGDILESVDGLSPLLSDIRIFDMYTGPQVPEGKKSVAFTLTFQGEQTLTDEEVKQELDKIISHLSARFGALVRGV